MAVKPDSEVRAMQQALIALGELDQGAQRRVLDWLAQKLDLAGASQGMSGAGIGAGPKMVTPAGGPTLTPKLFLAEKRPATDAERVACLAFFLTHYRSAAVFKTKEVNDLNSEAAQPRFANASYVLRDATARNQYLAPAKGGAKQISVRGEAIVNALPNREAVRAALEATPVRRRGKAAKGGGKKAQRSGRRAASA